MSPRRTRKRSSTKQTAAVSRGVLLVDDALNTVTAPRAKKSLSPQTPRYGSEKFFKTGATFWMNMQTRCNLEVAEDELAPQIEKIAAYEAA